MADEAEDLRDDLPPEPEGAPDDQAPPPADEPGQDSPPPQAPGLEDLAREVGWKPEAEWKGDKSKWTPADEFLRHKAQKAERVSDEIRGVREQLDRLSRTSAAIAERAIAEERAKLQRQFEEAVGRGDANAAYRLGQQLDATQVPSDDPVRTGYESFVQRNPWFNDDSDARAYAIGVAELNKDKPPEEQFRLAEAAVRRKFPELFGDQQQAPARRQAAPLVNAPTSRASQSAPRARGVADLPREARDIGKDFVRRGRVSSLEDYAKMYWQENA